MKIGDLAKACDVSRDTIRYYVDLELLLPSREGPQMNFGQRELADLKYIQRLKRMHFNLKEIQALFSLRRMSNLMDPEALQAYRELLLGKQQELVLMQQELSQVSDMLQEEINACPVISSRPHRPTGVPLRALPLLACPVCQKQLEIKGGHIISKYLTSGELTCSCGYRAEITDGVLQTGRCYAGQYDHPDLQRGLYRNVGDSFATCFQRVSDRVLEELTGLSSGQKVIMETNINGYFFLFHTLEHMKTDHLYIVTDKYPEMLAMYKNRIEQYGQDLDILYIADDSGHFPLRHACADILIDFFGSNEHFLYKKDPYLSLHRPFLAADGHVLGALFGFERGSRSLAQVPVHYPECSPIALDAAAMLDSCKSPDALLDTELVGKITGTCGQYSFACHQDGENLLVYYYHVIPKPY